MKKLVILILAFFSLLSFAGVVYAANWQEIETFTGAVETTTDYFTIPTTEWRIKWSITPDSKYPEYAALYVDITPKDEDSYRFLPSVSGDEKQTSGIVYVHEGAEDYYLYIGAANLEGYTITIEYDAEAPIPEYTPLMVAAALGLCTVSIAVFAKQSRKRKAA